MNFEKFEDDYYKKGYKNICGIDEVGRGCLFGDVVSCAIIMPKGDYIEGVNDSKKLTPKKREELYTKILESCVAVGIGRADADIIDKVNIEIIFVKDGQKNIPIMELKNTKAMLQNITGKL